MTIQPNKPGPNNANMIYVPAILFTILCPLMVGLRFWARLRKGGKLGADDYSITCALAFALASSGAMIASCKYGFGQHIFLLTQENKINALKWFFITQITYKSSINLTKCSILLLYIRIFSNVRWFKWACYFLVASVALYATASVTATIFQCTPIPRAFNKTIPGTCINNQRFWWANAGFSVASDLLILFIPMPLIYQLQVPRIQKMALVLVFALGGFVVITSCLRMTTINIAATSPDSTYDIASTMWTVIEMNVSIVCACLPMVRPLLIKVFPRLLPKSGSNKYSGAASKSGFSNKGYIMSRSQDRADHSNWTPEGKDAITLTTICKGDQGSEEYILHDMNPSDPSAVLEQARQATAGPLSKNGFGIQKSVQIQSSVEYTGDQSRKEEWA